jgi:hypothetical protein
MSKGYCLYWYQFYIPFMNGIMWFENLPKKTDLIEEFRRVLAKHAYGRMRSVIIRKGSQVFFKEISMEDFDLYGRFIEHTVFNEDEIVKSIEELLITGMEDGKPLWEFHLYQSKQGRSAILAKSAPCYSRGALFELRRPSKSKNGSRRIYSNIRKLFEYIRSFFEFFDLAPKTCKMIGRICVS